MTERVIHTAAINGRPVRFVSGKPPRTVAGDLLGAVGVPPKLRAGFMRVVGSDAITMRLDNDIVTLLSFDSALGLVQAAIDLKFATPAALEEFGRGCFHEIFSNKTPGGAQ